MSVPAFVMKIFEPSITHSPSSSRAVVRAAPASEPAPGSVSPNAASLRPRREVGEPLAPLLLGAEEVDRQRPERVVRRDRDRDRRVDPRQLLDRDRVRERVGAAAAVLLGDRHPHQPELGQLGDELVREALLAVELLGDRRDPLERELPHRVADQLVLRSEIEVHLEVDASQTRPRLGSPGIGATMVPRKQAVRVETILCDGQRQVTRPAAPTRSPGSATRSVGSSPSVRRYGRPERTVGRSSRTAAASSARRPSSRGC